MFSLSFCQNHQKDCSWLTDKKRKNIFPKLGFVRDRRTSISRGKYKWAKCGEKPKKFL